MWPLLSNEFGQCPVSLGENLAGIHAARTACASHSDMAANNIEAWQTVYSLEVKWLILVSTLQATASRKGVK